MQGALTALRLLTDFLCCRDGGSDPSLDLPEAARKGAAFRDAKYDSAGRCGGGKEYFCDSVAEGLKGPKTFFTDGGVAAEQA